MHYAVPECSTCPVLLRYMRCCRYFAMACTRSFNEFLSNLVRNEMTEVLVLSSRQTGWTTPCGILGREIFSTSVSYGMNRVRGSELQRVLASYCAILQFSVQRLSALHLIEVRAATRVYSELVYTCLSVVLQGLHGSNQKTPYVIIVCSSLLR